MNDNDIVLECRGVSHRFGSNHVLHDINLKVIRGEIVALVGPSGCGKSTLLRAIIGTHPPTRGQILVAPPGEADSVVSGPGRDRGIVYQRYSLFPFLTAIGNVAFGLKLDQSCIPFRVFRPLAWSGIRKRHRAEAAALLTRLGLEKAVGRYPSQLSGGMCQRVAIAQALIMKPAVLLLDEPFGALDEATREDLQQMLLSLYAENVQAKRDGRKPPYTILIVTHEINEALYVGDRVVAMSPFWNWKEKGFAEFPGATLVYDRPSPVFLPESGRDFTFLKQQREEILRVAFDPKNVQDHQEFLRFWHEIAAGEGRGVLQNE